MTDSTQGQMNLRETGRVDNVEDYQFKPIKGYPMLHWHGKRPFTSTHYYPAQHKETHGPEVEGWRNKIYWGDNLQVMSHLLKEYRGKVKLVYIDPPFDSKADYKKKIRIKEKDLTNDQNAFEEKQYTDIWTNDVYLQFVYERIILIRELLSDEGSVFFHCDYHKNHFIRCVLDEVFGQNNFRNEIVWKRRSGRTSTVPNVFESVAETIYWYSKTENYQFRIQYTKLDTDDYVSERFRYKDNSGRLYRLSPLNSPNPRPNLHYVYKGFTPHPNGWSVSRETMEDYDQKGKLYFPEDKNQRIQRKQYLDEWEGKAIQSLWVDIAPINPQASERLDYPTQKPEALLERIIKTTSKSGDIVFDCFMGSGTTQTVAMKLGRRFIGADINLGAVQVTTKRLLRLAGGLENQKKLPKQSSLLDEEKDAENSEPTTFYTGFEVYNVNHYDVFRNPVEARELLIQALEINKLEAGHLFDGEKDGRLWKIMPVNRIATRQDLNDLIANFDYRTFEKRHAERPNQPVEKITLVCMGHEPDLAATLTKEIHPFKLDVEVVDILRDRQDIQFKRDSEARVVVKGGYLVIEAFYPMNLLSKLSLQQENVAEWRELVESVMVDWNYDGAVLQPALVDIPDKDELVNGRYPIPAETGTIRLKITDLLSESLEIEVAYG